MLVYCFCSRIRKSVSLSRNFVLKAVFMICYVGRRIFTAFLKHSLWNSFLTLVSNVNPLFSCFCYVIISDVFACTSFVKPNQPPVLWRLYRSTCISWHLQLRTGWFCWCKILLLVCIYWWQAAHSEDAGVFLNRVIYIVLHTAFVSMSKRPNITYICSCQLWRGLGDAVFSLFLFGHITCIIIILVKEIIQIINGITRAVDVLL